MEYTKNYKLPQWVETDRILMEDFNQMCADIDAGLEKVKSEVAEEVSALAEGQQSMVESMNTSLEAISANLGSGGKTARIAWGNYTGTGTYGRSNPTALTFDFKPILVFIVQGGGDPDALEGMPMFNSCMLVNPITAAMSTTGCGLYVTWSENSVSWFVNTSETNAAYGQNNTKNLSYYYVALGISQ